MSAAAGQGRPAAGGGAPGAPAAADWAGRSQWRLLHLGPDGGLHFLRTWRLWKDDPHRPGLLHCVALHPAFPTAPSLHAAARADPGLAGLAEWLARQWFGLLPGFHRLAFEDHRVLLTLCVGDVGPVLRELAFPADRVVLDGPKATDLHRLKALARLCRPGTRLVWTTGPAAPRQADLRQCGFIAAPEPAPDRDLSGIAADATAGQAVFDPPWLERAASRPVQVRAAAAQPGHCVVVGAGLAGAAVAASLARRGWQVEVLDAGQVPAGGASGLPAGLLVPHQSADDSLLSRLSRAGVRMTLNEATRLLRRGEDWAPSGVLAHRDGIHATLPASPPTELADWSRPASAAQTALAGLEAGAPALWHENAAWIRPAALVRAWLGQPGVRWRGGVEVARVEPCPQGWRLLDPEDRELALCTLLVVAAGHQSQPLLPTRLPLQAVRGQLSWSLEPPGLPLPPFPVSGDGHFLSGVPGPGGAAWLCGATFERDDTDLSPRQQDHASNLARLARLLPTVAEQLAGVFAAGRVQAWTGVRCASADRRPLVGEVAPGFWVSTAMGSRGLTFAHLCAEAIAARLHAEPLPLPRRLAAALDVLRVRPSTLP